MLRARISANWKCGILAKTGFYQVRQKNPEPSFGEEDSQEYDQRVVSK